MKTMQGAFFLACSNMSRRAMRHADEHFDEVGTGNREEGHIRLTGDGAGEKRLARARRPDEQNALGNAAPEFLEFLWVLQEVDDLDQIFLSLIDARHVLEGHAALALGQHLGPALAEPMALPPPACICRIRKIITATNSSSGTS